MKKNSIYQAYSKGCVRIASQPYERFLEWSEECSKSQDRGYQYLIEFFSEPRNNDALYIASAQLWASHQKAQESVPEEDKKKKLAMALSSYFSRMCSRSTPFGGFASVGGVKITGNFSFHADSIRKTKYVARIDSEVAYILSRYYLENYKKHPSITFKLNTSFRKVGNDAHYYETVDAKNGKRLHRLSKVDRTPPLDSVLNFLSHNNGVNYSAIVDHLVISFGEEHRQKIVEFVDELIGSQVIVSSLTLPITSEVGIIEWLAIRLESIDANEASSLRKLNLECLSIGDANVSISQATKNIQKLLEQIGVIPPKNILQVDLANIGDQGEIPQSLSTDVNHAIFIGNLLSKDEGRSKLDLFKERFVQRYGNHFVSILNAIDEDSGLDIGKSTTPDTGILSKITWSNQSIQPNTSTNLLDLISSTIEQYPKSEEIDLALIIDNQIIHLENINPPEVSSVILNVHAKSAQEFNKGDYLVEVGGGGASGGFLFSRFSHVLTELDEIGRELAEIEANRHDPIIVELAYQPIERLANVCLRKPVRQYELEILAQSGASEEQKLSLSDILVGVLDDRVILWSKSLGREIIVRHSTAYNSELAGNLGVFQFLCWTQWQHRKLPMKMEFPSVKFTKYTPRLVYHKVLIRRASWSIQQNDLKAIRKSPHQIEAMQKFRAEACIPRYIVYGQRDNKIIFNLDNFYSICDFLKRAKEETVLIEEAFPRDYLPWLKSNSGHHVAEFVMPLIRRSPPHKLSSISENQVLTALRGFPLGSKWLSIKIYSGLHTRSKIIATVFPELQKQLESNYQWFFLRYSDPDTHVRLRVLHADAGKVLGILHRELTRLIGLDRIHRIETDTYIPETYRYGGSDSLRAVERIFYLDSSATLDFLSGQEKSEEELFGRIISSIIAYFKLFTYSKHERNEILGKMKEDMYKTVGASGETRSAVGKLFGEYYSRLASTVTKKNIEMERFILEAKPYAVEIMKLNERGKLTVSIESIVRSLIHMSLNRLIPTYSTQQESVYYDLLYRYSMRELSRHLKNSPVEAENCRL